MSEILMKLLSSEFIVYAGPLLFVVSVGSLYDAFCKWIPGRNERLKREQEHRHQLQLLKVKQDHELALAEKLQDPVQILALDPEFGASFDRKLRVALSKEGIEYPLEVSEEDVEEVEMEEYVKGHTKRL